MTFTWTCPACRHAISDRAPYESHPKDDEHGHADGRTRLAAITDWRAQYGEY